MDREILHKEIDLIQSCITRMANNSFLIKGWVITLVSVIVALKADNSKLVHLISLIPLISFWMLDAYFLRLERAYRKMYEDVLNMRKNGNDDKLYYLNPTPYLEKVDTLIKVIFSSTLCLFYGGLFLLAEIFIYFFIVN